jgi:hypothetical protein
MRFTDDGMIALESPCGNYRYRLDDPLGDGPQVTFILLNPSGKAGRKRHKSRELCREAAEKELGKGCRITMVNLFGRYAEDYEALLDLRPDDLVGPDNDRHLLAACREATKVVCAWGNDGMKSRRDRVVLPQLRDLDLYCLIINTVSRAPRHPSRLQMSQINFPLPLYRESAGNERRDWPA